MYVKISKAVWFVGFQTIRAHKWFCAETLTALFVVLTELRRRDVARAVLFLCREGLQRKEGFLLVVFGVDMQSAAD